MDPKPKPDDPEPLERLRRELDLRLDALGRFSVGGDPITHLRTERALRAGLDLGDRGQHVVRVGQQWAYLTVADCPLRALACSVDPDTRSRLMVLLDDGRILPLDPTTLWEEPGRGLRCTVPSRPSGRPLAVRFSNRAALELSAWVELCDTGPVLALGGSRTPIPEAAPGPSTR